MLAARIGITGLAVALFVLASLVPRFPGDLALLLWVQRFDSPMLTQTALTITRLGDTQIALGLMGVGLAVMVLVKRRDVAALILLSLISIGLGNLLKQLVDRPRPDYLVSEYLLLNGPATSLSFPSGHALFVATFGGILFWFVSSFIVTRWIRMGLQASLVLLILVVGWSRVYLGLHWPSDVLGGYVYGFVTVWMLTDLRRVLLYRL